MSRNFDGVKLARLASELSGYRFAGRCYGYAECFAPKKYKQKGGEYFPQIWGNPEEVVLVRPHALIVCRANELAIRGWVTTEDDEWFERLCASYPEWEEWGWLPWQEARARLRQGGWP